jgi:hypothetical protein|nr:MAG: hypothetical protein [Caudoviricetes sp.]
MSLTMNKKNFPGLDGFIWWTGIVESRDDPKKIGRLQIRIYGWHTDEKKYIPSDELLWAQPIFPTNSSNDTYTCKEGDTVFGFFLDNDSAQYPVVFGRIPDVPAKLYPASKGFSDPGKSLGSRPVQVASRTMTDGEGIKHTDAGPTRYPNPLNEATTSRFARNENIDKTPLPFIKQNIKKGIDTANDLNWDELDPAYEAKYPYNDSVMSESGHFFDIDDTKKKERVNLMHRTGTMYEVKPSGSTHQKDLKHRYHLVHGTDMKNVRGNLWHTTEKYTRYKSKGKAFIDLHSILKMRVGKYARIDVNEEVEISSLKSITLSAPVVTICADFINLNGTTYVAEQLISPTLTSSILSSASVMSTAVFGGLVEAVVPPPIVLPSSGGTCLLHDEIEQKDPCEAYVDEQKKGGCEEGKSDAKEEEPAKKLSREELMQKLFDIITGPGAGGTGENWCYTNSKGEETCIFTHHATSDCAVLTYIWCDGGGAVETDLGKNYDIPDGWTCPIDTGGEICGGEIDVGQ